MDFSREDKGREIRHLLSSNCSSYSLYYLPTLKGQCIISILKTRKLRPREVYGLALDSTAVCGKALSLGLPASKVRVLSSSGRREEKGPKFTSILVPFLTPWGDNRTYLTGLWGAIPGTQSHIPMVFHWVQSLTRILNRIEREVLIRVSEKGDRIDADKNWGPKRCKVGMLIEKRDWLQTHTACKHLKGPLSRVSSSWLQNAAKCQFRTRGCGAAPFLGGLWNINSPVPGNLAGGRVQTKTT